MSSSLMLGCFQEILPPPIEGHENILLCFLLFAFYFLLFMFRYLTYVDFFFFFCIWCEVGIHLDFSL